MASVSLRREPSGAGSPATLRCCLRRPLRCADGWRGGDHHRPGAASALKPAGQAAARGRGQRAGSDDPVRGRAPRRQREPALHVAQAGARGAAGRGGVAEPGVRAGADGRRDQHGGGPLDERPCLAPAPAPSSRFANAPGLIEIDLGNGRQVRVGRDVNLAALRRVLAALRE